MSILFTLAAASTLDETLTRVFTSEEDLRGFIATLGPVPDRDSTTIREVYYVRGMDIPSEFLGWVVTKVEDGIPTDMRFVDDEDGPFDPALPLFYKPETTV